MGKINVDYDVLNQKGSPAWYSDLFANIPTPGYTGRMFISTDTFAFYRDNGTGWDLTGGPGIGTITGSGVSGQVSFFSGTQVLGGSTNLIWDNTNNRLGIGVASPTVTLEISGSVKATALVKSGGTSAQILLADGTTTPTSTFQAAITLTTTGTTGASTLVGATLNVPTYTFVSSVSALTLGTSGTDLTSSVANSTTTPTITLNVPTASATNRGALSSADWTTFNNKQATITLTTTGTSGAATLVGATLNVPNYTNVGTVTSVAALTLGTSGTDLSSSVANSTSTPVITLNVPTASATNRGALSSADFTTFNNKQATISVTAPVVLTGATISMPAATTSVNGYLTSTDWNTFNNKSNTNGTVTDVVALTIGTSGIDITSTAVTTTTTPVITLNIPTASASNRGALSSTDWTIFNNKQATLTLTTTGTSGAATFSSNTLNIPNYGSALSGYLPLSGGTLTGALGGTSATFTSTGNAITITSSSSASNVQLKVNNGTNGDIYAGVSASDGSSVFTGTTAYSGYIGTNISVPFQIASNGSVRLTIASTGAATFSSSVTADGGASEGSIRIERDTVGTNTVIGSLAFTNNNSATTYGKVFGGRNSAGDGYVALGTGVSNNLYALESGNVGIGTSSPAATLQVVGDVYVGSYHSANKLCLGADTNDFLQYSSSLDGILMASYGATAFYTGASSTERMRIHSDGNISIGNATNTGDLLYLAGNLKMITNGKIDSNGGNLLLQSATGVNTIIGSTTDNNGKLQVNSSINVVTANYITPSGLLQIYGYYSTYGGPIIQSLNSTQTATVPLRFESSVINVTGRGNFLGATDNSLFSLNSGGTLYTVGFSPTATASSTNTFTITNGTTTWIYTGSGAATWTLPNPSGNNQIYWIKNAGTGAITLTAFSGTNIIDNSAASVGTISIAVGATAVIAQDGNVKSYQLQ